MGAAEAVKGTDGRVDGRTRRSRSLLKGPPIIFLTVGTTLFIIIYLGQAAADDEKLDIAASPARPECIGVLNLLVQMRSMKSNTLF